MPRIQEYLPEEAGAGPQGGASANLEAVNQLGQGIETLGRGTTELADTLESRSAMMESADAQASTSDAKAEFFNRVKDETNRGVLDQNKLFDDYDDWADKTGSQFNTPRGKAEFERASQRTRGSLIRWAAQGSAQIAGANAMADHTTAVNNLTNITSQDPHSFADNMGQLEEIYDGYQNDPNMNKNPQALQRMKQTEQAQLATASVTGLASQDFDRVVQDMVSNGGKVDPTDPKYNTASAMLSSGVYDDYLDAAHKNEITKTLRQNFTAAQTEGQRALNIQDAQRAQQTEAWEQQAVPKWSNNQLSVKEILGSPMAANDKIRWINMVQQSQKKEIATDPRVFNDVTSRILSPDNEPGHISDVSQLSSYVGKGLTIPDYMHAKELLSNSSQGLVDRENEKQMMDFAKAKLVNSNPMMGQKDPDGEYRLMLFSQGLQDAKQQAIQSGKPASSVLNPNSPDFFGKQIQRFVASPQDLLKRSADAQRGIFTPPTSVQTQPGTVPTPGITAQHAEETVTMYDKSGNARQIYKSKMDQAKSRGYSVK